MVYGGKRHVRGTRKRAQTLGVRISHLEYQDQRKGRQHKGQSVHCSHAHWCKRNVLCERPREKLIVVEHACNSSPRGTETGGSQFDGTWVTQTLSQKQKTNRKHKTQMRSWAVKSQQLQRRSSELRPNPGWVGAVLHEEGAGVAPRIQSQPSPGCPPQVSSTGYWFPGLFYGRWSGIASLTEAVFCY